MKIIVKEMARMAIFDERKKAKEESLNDSSSIFDERDLENKRVKKERKPKIMSSFSEISPIIDMTENGFFELNNDEGYLDILQLTSKDVYAMNVDEIEKDVVQFAYFNQWYTEDYKIIALNFPEDTSKQQRNTLKRLNNPAKPEYESFLQQKLNELQFIETDRTNREYFLFIYADDEYTLHSRVRNIKGILRNVFPIIQISEEKKINVLYKLFNLNSKNKTARGDY